MYKEMHYLLEILKKEELQCTWVPIVLFRVNSSLSESVNPIDVASVAY